jgi:DNA replication protein DnaC
MSKDQQKRNNELDALLKSLRLPTIIQNYRDFAARAEKEKFGFIDYLYELCQIESADKQDKRSVRLLSESRLPHGKTLDNYEFSRQPNLSRSLMNELAEGSLLDRCENILFFGVPGTGKSHLAVGLGREWCLRRRRVLFMKSAALVQSLLIAKRDLKLNEYIKDLDRFEAICIDDISYIPQTREETDVLFTLLAERYERRSVIVTSNLAFSDWSQIFKDKMTTLAAIDRLVHHAVVIELEGPSVRGEVAEQRSKAGRKPAK